MTGGAGFVGASLCLTIARHHPSVEVVALDSLKRRGSELNLARLREAGVRFVHGDVRSREDLLGLEPTQAIVECSAEPSVLAGMGGGADYVVQTNLIGAHNCLELARRDGAQIDLHLDQPRVPRRTPAAARVARRTRPASHCSPSSPSPDASAAGISEDVSARRRADAVRNHETRGRIARWRIRRQFRHPGPWWIVVV